MRNNILKTIKPFMVKHEPEILMFMGISGMVISIVSSIKATAKAVKKIEAKKKELKRDKLTTSEIIKETWKLYLPVVIGTAVSVPCIIMGNRVSNRRNVALAAAYTMTETALQEYQDKTKELLGEKNYEKLQETISGEKVTKTYEKNIDRVTLVGDGDALFFEPLSGRYFKTNWNRISKAANELNANALSDLSGVILLGEWYDILGLDSTELGNRLGWVVTDGKRGLIDISVDAVVTPENEPCGAIRYNTIPKQL